MFLLLVGGGPSKFERFRSWITSFRCFLFLAGYRGTVRILSFTRRGIVVLNDVADLGWLTGDVIAGVTVGMVVVPQGK